MVAHEVQQLAFGYDDGHRLLEGSIDLATRDVSLLLGATDAPPGSDTEHLLTGLPLPAADLYALAATWSAPESSRPGAVWSHVLLVDRGLLATLDAPLALTSLLVRPGVESLERYSRPISFSQASTGSQPPRRDLLERSITATYGGTPHVLIEPDIAEAIKAVGLIWKGQWPELRARFSFRTRDSVRGDSVTADLVVARRLRGTKRPSAEPINQRWVAETANSLLEPSATPLTAFLGEFGPNDLPETAAYGALVRIYEMVSRGSTASVREAVERRYPERQAGHALKVALFGRGDTRPWSGSELDRIISLLGAETDAWDAADLDLVERVASAIMATSAVTVSRATPQHPTATVQAALVQSLAMRAEPADIAAFAEHHRGIVTAVLEITPTVLEGDAAWSGLTAASARWLLRTSAGQAPGAINSAIRAGHAQAALAELGVARTVAALATTGDFSLAKAALQGVDGEAAAHRATEGRSMLLSSALWPGSAPHDALLATLEGERDRADEIWLRAAVNALATGESASAVLPVVFGPLHESMTADRLPQDCWQLLDPLLPPAPDPALRLRRYLLHVAQSSRWPTETFAHALRGAGPYTGELLHEFSDEDDWWVATARAIVRTAAGLFGR